MSPPPGGPTPTGRDGARSLDGAGSLARALLAERPHRATLAVALLFVSAVTETFGIALIIPLLYLAGLGGTEGAASGIRDALERAAGTLGVELTLPALLAA